MDTREFSKLIEKYKKGECSSRENELLERYLESFQNNRGEWNGNVMGNQRRVDEKIYSEIMKNIHKDKNHYFTRIFFTPALLKRAASILFFFILSAGIIYVSGIFEQKTDLVTFCEKVTSSGEKSIITLSDGSIVTLNADSKLKYPVQFDETDRNVFLEGEAYFEVYHNTKQPFVVHSEKLSTTVLGTIFNVSAYPENKTIVVSLLEGSVKVSSGEKEKNNEVVVLKPKEQLLYDKAKGVSTFETFDSLEVVGWRDNIYKFENEPLGDVLSQLERAFSVKFKLANKSVLEQKITIKFEKKSIQTVVDVIKSLTGLDYKVVKGNNDEKEVLFF